MTRCTLVGPDGSAVTLKVFGDAAKKKIWKEKANVVLDEGNIRDQQDRIVRATAGGGERPSPSSCVVVGKVSEGRGGGPGTQRVDIYYVKCIARGIEFSLVMPSAMH